MATSHEVGRVGDGCRSGRAILTGRLASWHLRAMRDGLWRRLAVAQNHSRPAGLRRSSMGEGQHE
jgi:hypothetical protein